MKDLPALPEDTSPGYFYTWDHLLESMGFDEQLVECSTQDYQGDTFVLAKKGGRFAVLVWGWGSCSGCDSLQATSTVAQVEELRDQVYNEARWFDSIAALMGWMESESPDLSWYGSDHVWLRFRKEVNEQIVQPLAPGELAEVLTSIQNAWEAKK